MLKYNSKRRQSFALLTEEDEQQLARHHDLHQASIRNAALRDQLLSP